MTPQQDIEMAIRTAQLIKSLSQLVSVGSAQMAKLVFAESVKQFGELGRFIDKCNASGKKDQHSGDQK